MNRNHKVRLKNLTVIANDSNCFAAIANCKSAALSAIGAGLKLLCSSSLLIAMGLSCSYQAFAVDSYITFSQNRAGVNDLGGAINELGYRINEVKDNANAGISAAMAMSSIPQSFLPGRSLVGGSITTYNGENAVAIGLSTVSKSGQWIIKANGTADTQGNTGGAFGAGFHF